MGKISVNTDTMESLADLLERQAEMLENIGESASSTQNSLSMRWAGRNSVMSAIKTTSSNVQKEAQTAAAMGRTLRQIAETYRLTENRIAGYETGIPQGGNQGNNGQGSVIKPTKNEKDQNGENKSSGVYSTDPVNLNNGNFILDNKDMEIGGEIPLVLGRFYNSRGDFSGMLGDDWNTNFEMKLFKAPMHQLFGNDICIMLEDGREEYFSSADGKKYRSDFGSTAELSKCDDGYIYETLEGKKYYFNELGQYTRFENAHSVGFDLIYDGEKLQTVKKDSGEGFAFFYNEEGKLQEVKDHAGRSCKYIFEKNRLQQVVLPDENKYEYSYNPYGKIKRVINPRNVDAVETEYDDLHRVVHQKFADDTTNIFEYNDVEMSVTMTERNGSKSIHYHNEKYQNIRNVYPDGEESFIYNEKGQKTAATDKLGNTTHIQYDNKGNMTGLILPDKTKIAATYDKRNHLLTMSVNGKMKIHNQYNECGDLINSTDGVGRKTAYTYDEKGRLISVKRADGSQVSAVYDAHGNMKTLTDATGGIWEYEYNEWNQIVSQKDAMGRISSCTYDIKGNLTSFTRADGKTMYYRYDAWGNVISEEDYAGNTIKREYNENNKLISLYDAQERKTAYEYDSMWNVKKVVLPGDRVFEYIYDGNNHLKTAVDAMGNATNYEYDPMGNIVTVTDACENKIQYTWDSNGNCIKVVDACGNTSEYQYNEDGEVVYVKDPEGIELFRIFDDAGQLVEEKDSLGKTRKYTYDLMGNVSSIKDEKDHITYYQYEKGTSHISEVTYADGNKEFYTHDAAGNVTSYKDVYGATLYYEYDQLDRLVSLKKETGEALEYTYDCMGRITREKDFSGNVTSYEYSATGAMTAITDALGNTTWYSYNQADELMEVLRGVPGSEQIRRTIYERDSMGHITKVTDPSGEKESYCYDQLGHMIQKTDREGIETNYQYNAIGLLSRVQFSDGRSADYDYTPLQRLHKVQDWTGTTEINYNGVGNVVQIRYPDERTLDISYDPHNNISQMIYPDGKQISYAYDAWDRLIKITQDKNSIVYGYDHVGRVTEKRIAENNRIQYEYNPFGEVKKIQHLDERGVLDSFEFGYDKLGRKLEYGVYRRDYSKDNGRYAYLYDPAGHLKQVYKNNELIREYFYDSLGNRSKMLEYDPVEKTSAETEYLYDPAGTLKQVKKGEYQEEYRYDKRGNLIRQIIDGRIEREYQYDALNRLNRVKTAEKTAIYEYNGLGYRTRKCVTDQKQIRKDIRYVSDYRKIYNNLLERANGAEAEDYFWGQGLECYSSRNGTAGWYVTDALGSVLREGSFENTVTDSSDSYREFYDEFGNMSLGQEQEDEFFGYNGFLFDSVAGTWFAQARQYRSGVGMFDARDRFGGEITTPETVNPYTYCINDPLNYTDKSGYWFGLDDAIAAGIGAVGGVAGQFIGDVIDGVTSGKFEFSSWQSYTGAAIGGAAGGVTTLYVGPIAGGAVAGGVTRLTTEGLTYVSDPKKYNKSAGQVIGETAIDAGMGALSGAVTKLLGKVTEKLTNTKCVQGIIKKLNSKGKVGSYIAGKLSDIALGKKNAWGTMSKILKNQHEAIAKSSGLRRKLYSVLLHAMPVYMFETIRGKLLDKMNPIKIIRGKMKSGIVDWLKEKLGLAEKPAECAAGSFGGGGGGGGFR